jgi:uncharacterized protein YbjT (DUF2867 family)
MTRDPSKVAPRPGIEVVGADLDDPASLKPAVDGVTALFLLTAPAGPEPIRDVAMLDAAVAAGVERVVRLSAIGSGVRTVDGDGNEVVVGAWHQQADEAVQDSGVVWTVLRPTTFASNTLSWADALRAGRPVANPLGDGRQGIVDPRDVAAVAVEILAATGSAADVHAGHTYTLTGPDLLSVAEQATQLSQVLDRPIAVVDQSLDATRAGLLAAGTDPAVVDAIVAGLGWARAGHNAIVTSTVADILGRPPATFTTWSHDHRAAFGLP